MGAYANDDDPFAPAGPRPGQAMLAADPMAGMGGTGKTPGSRLDPALVASVLRQQNAGTQNKLAQQQKQAQMIREMGMQGMQGRQAGGVYIAPNIANLAAAGIGAYKAHEMDEAAQGTAQGMDAAATKQNREWFELMRGLGG